MLGSALRKGIAVNRIASEREAWRGRNPWPTRNDYPTVAGVKVSPSTAMIAASVYTAVTLNSDTMGALPIRFIDREDAARLPATPPGVPALTGPRANPFQTLQDVVQTVMLSQDLWGEAFLYPRRSRAGDVIEVWPIDPDRITEVERLEDGKGSLGLRFRVDGWPDNNGWIENRPGRPVEMLHIPLRTLPGRIRGISPVAMQAELLGMSLSAQEHASRFLGDGVHLSGTIETAADLDPTEAKELWDNFQRVHAGPKTAGRVGVLTGGATFKTITIPPNELQFLEQMKYADQKITALYRVPPHLVGDVEKQTSWGSGVEEQTNNWVKFSLLGRGTKIEGVIEADLLAGTPYQMRFQFNGLLRGVAKDRAEFYRILWNLGVFSPNDIASLEDLPPIEGGDQRFIPLNMVPLGEAPDPAMSSRAQLLAGLLVGGR